MGRTSKNIKLRIPENPRKIKGFRKGSYRVATTISSQPRYDHFDTSPKKGPRRAWDRHGGTGTIIKYLKTAVLSMARRREKGEGA